MDSSQLICDEAFNEVCEADSGSASPPRVLERDQKFSDMIKPDFRASIPGYPAPARKGTKRPAIEQYLDSSDEDQPDLGNFLESNEHKFNLWWSKRGLF